MSDKEVKVQCIYTGFSNAMRIETNRDILAIGIMNSGALTEGEQQTLKMKAAQVTDLQSISALKRRITEFVHIHSIESVPIKLGTLNRRFSKIAKKLGSSVSELTQMLIQDGHLRMLERSGMTALVSVLSQKERLSILNETNESVGKAYDLMMENAL